MTAAPLPCPVDGDVVVAAAARVLDALVGPSEPVVSHGLAVTASVPIIGAWPAVVALTTDTAVAALVAGAMFGLEPGDTTYDDRRDAFGELANMVAGAVKGAADEALGVVCELGLPTVACGAAEASGTVLVAGLVVYAGLPVAVQVSV